MTNEEKYITQAMIEDGFEPPIEGEDKWTWLPKLTAYISYLRLKPEVPDNDR